MYQRASFFILSFLIASIVSHADDSKETTPQETVAWMQSHIKKLIAETSTPAAHSEGKVRLIQLSGKELTVVKTYFVRGYVTTDSATKAIIPLSDVVGKVEIVTKKCEQCTPAERTYLRLLSRPERITVITSQYSDLRMLDGTDIGRLDEPAEAVYKRVIEDKGKREKLSEFEIPVDPEMSERFQKALNHLVTLQGGGKKEPF
jgi:hypothetical protein